MTVQVRHPRLVEAAHHRQEAGLVGGDPQVGDAEQERLVALVGAAVDQVGGLGVGARDDDAGHPHDVELEAGGVEALDLFVRRDEDLAALVAALLRARTLVLDVVAGHARLDETANQVAHVWISAVAGVGVGDDERPEVDGRRRRALLVGHAQAQVLLVAVGGEQCAHQPRGLVGYLAQRIACEVGTRVLARGALGRGRPAAEVDPLDAHPLHRHGLTGRVRPEGGDALVLGEEFAQAVVEGRRRLARDRVVGGDRAALLDDLARRIEADDPLEAWAVEVSLHCGDILLERGLGLCISFDDGHASTLRRTFHRLCGIRTPWRSSRHELLTAVDVEGGAGQRGIDHQVDGERTDLSPPSPPGRLRQLARTVRVSSSARISGSPANRPSSACAATTAGSDFLVVGDELRHVGVHEADVERGDVDAARREFLAERIGHRPARRLCRGIRAELWRRAPRTAPRAHSRIAPPPLRSMTGTNARVTCRVPK